MYVHIKEGVLQVFYCYERRQSCIFLHVLFIKMFGFTRENKSIFSKRHNTISELFSVFLGITVLTLFVFVSK